MGKLIPQFVLGLLLTVAGLARFIWWLRRPGRRSLLGLSPLVFVQQFCAGSVIFSVLGMTEPSAARGRAVLTHWLAFRPFWRAIGLVGGEPW